MDGQTKLIVAFRSVLRKRLLVREKNGILDYYVRQYRKSLDRKINLLDLHEGYQDKY
jgi:hypothetical protein